MNQKKTDPATDVEQSVRGRRKKEALRAISSLSKARDAMIADMADYINRNRDQIAQEIDSPEGYSFALQQVEDNYLNRINRVERSLHLLYRFNTHEVTTTYEAVELKAPRAELPQRICDLLAERAGSVLLEVVPLRIDDATAELLVVFSKEEKK